MSSSKACGDFRPHAYVQNKCRDCMRPEAEHVGSSNAAAGLDVKVASPTLTPTDQAAGSGDSPGAHAHAFDNLEAVGADALLSENCTHYTPHAWIYDRCRDWSVREETKDLKGKKEI